MTDLAEYALVYSFLQSKRIIQMLNSVFFSHLALGIEKLEILVFPAESNN